MGPFMVEIVYCRVTRRGRKKMKGMNKLARENMRNDGPAFQFLPPEDTVKVTLDLSENGPVFSALDDMMMRMLDEENASRQKAKKGSSDDAKKSLKRLLKSGIPGVEKMFAPPPDPNNPNAKKNTKGFHKMTDGSKQKFMKAIFGEDGTSIDSDTAAALLAATCSGGDPEIGENIAQILLPELSDKVDPHMMAALMSSSSLINAGANTEEVMKAMKLELASSGLSEEEILLKTQKLMKVFRREESSSMAEYSLSSKQTNVALKKNGTSPKDFTQAVIVQKALAVCGTSPENIAKVIMIQNQLAKKGAQSRHIADAMRNQGDFDNKRPEVIEKITKAMTEDKLKKEDVFMNVRLAQALENENEPSWKEVRTMKDILQGCSPNSPEAIELNLTRAIKTAGLKAQDIAAALVAQKVLAAINVDAKSLSQIINVEKTIAENGVPSVEIARVLADAAMPKELFDQIANQMLTALPNNLNEHDVDCFIKLYENLRLKANLPLEVVDDIDKNLIQVRCSLEDVADNMVSSQLARGEKEHMVIRGLCETLLKTGASPEIVGATMMCALRKVLSKGECEIMKDTGRTLFEQGVRGDDLTKVMTELILNLLDENIELREEAAKAMELVLKEAGGFPDQIRQLLQDVLPPEPPRPMSPRLVAELERLRAQEEARDAEKARKALAGDEDSDASFDEDEPDSKPRNKKMKNGKLKNPAVDNILSDSRRGSLIPPGSRRGSGQRSRCGSISLGGVERRGSFYSDDISKRSTVAVVVDDPDGKKQMEAALKDVFDGDHEHGAITGGGGAYPNGFARAANGEGFVGVPGLPGQPGVSGGPGVYEPSGVPGQPGFSSQAFTEALASSLGVDVSLLQQMANVPPPVPKSVMEAIINAQKSLPPGAAQNPQAVLQAIMQAQGHGKASEIPKDVLESIINAQKNLPPGAAQNPEAMMQAYTRTQVEAAVTSRVSPDVMESIIKAQQSLPPGAAQNPQAILQAIVKAQGAGALKDIPPKMLEEILNAQKNLPPGAAQNPQAIMQAFVQKQMEATKPPGITPDALEFILRAQKSLPPGSAQNPQAILQAVMKAHGAGAAKDISPQALEAILNAQKMLPPGIPPNPQMLLQAATQAQSGVRVSDISQNVLESILNAQKNLPPGASQNPQAIIEAVMKAQGNRAASDISPQVLEAILNAQKKLPPGASVNPQAILQSVTISSSNLASFPPPNPVLQAAIKAQVDAAKSVTPDILEAVLKAQRLLPSGSTQDPQALLQAIAKSSGGSTNISPEILAAVLNAQKNLPAGSSQNPKALLESVKQVQDSLSSCSTGFMSPAALQSVLHNLPPEAQQAAMAQITQQQTMFGTNGQMFGTPPINSLPPAAIAALVLSQRNLPPGASSIPQEVLDATARMSPEELAAAFGPGGALADTLRENADKLQSLLDNLADSGNGGGLFNGGSFHLSTIDGKLSDDDVAKLMSVFKTSGVVSNIGGISKFRTMADMRDTVQESQTAFDNAINQAKNRPVVGISDENRKLMEEILRNKLLEQQDINSRVSMLLAGSSLTTTSGVKIQRRDSIKEVSYDMLVTDHGTSGDKYRRRTEDYNDPSSAARAAADRLSALTSQAASGMEQLQRSMKRTSLVRLRRLSEASEQKRKEEEEKRRIIGLRRAKVPLMVYSCGGFTRCFRIARYHVAEGPPIGVAYERDRSSHDES